jgi:hypothetical protein
MNSAFRPHDQVRDELDTDVDHESLELADPTTDGELPPSDLDAWLDRLVDGEVAEPQRQAILSRLEQAPQGWRRCALAFLEAQAWREALEPSALLSNDGRSGALPTTSESARPELRVVSRQGVVQRLTSRWRPVVGMLAAVASFLVAFTLGLAAQKLWFGPGSGHTAMPVAKTKGSANAPEILATGPTKSTPGQGSKEPNWGTVRFAVNGPGGTPQQVRLPALDGADMDGREIDQWLRDQPPAIPDEIVRELRRLGHHVETRRQYLPVPLDDGRGAVFPVDQVEVRLRGGQGYQ